MGISGLRLAGPAVALAILPLGLTACGLVGGSDDDGGTGAPPEDGADKSRVRVQSYLDAMKTKDVDTGRGQLCAPMQAAFDKSATGTSGDFAKHFTVSEATITDVHAEDGNQIVSTSITVTAGGRKSAATILFTVAHSNGDWCIAKEAPGTDGSSAPDAGDESSN